MHLFSVNVVLISVLFTFCNSQTYSGYRYPVRRRAGYSYNDPYSNRPKSYYTSTSNRNPVQTNPTTLNSYYQQTPRRNYKQTTTTGYYNPYNERTSTSSTLSGSRGSSYPYNQQTSSINLNSRRYYSPTNTINRNVASSSSLTGLRGSSPDSKNQSSLPIGSRGSSNSASDPINNKQYLTNSYNKLLADKESDKNRVSKADSENAKFAGADNLETEEDSRTLHLKRRKLRRRFGSLASPCFPYGRDAGNAVTPPPKEQGRFLWDVNVYNVYPQTSNSFGCGGGLSNFGGLGGIGGGLLSDPIDRPYYPPGTGLANFLATYAPGVLQNSLAVTTRPQLYADDIQQSQSNGNFPNNDAQSDPEVDPNYRPQQIAQPIRRPNRIYFDSAGANAITPGQLLGGVATTVNGIIQQLTGNVQPVYG